MNAPGAAPSNGDVLAVVSQSGPTITFFDAVSHERLDVLEVPVEPHELCWDPDHGVLYCTTTYGGGYYHDNVGRRSIVSVVDVRTREIVETIDLSPEHAPHGLALDRRAGRLYISVEGDFEGTRQGGAVVLDTATREVIGKVDTEARGPHWFAVTPDGRQGYAANKEADFVTVVDLGGGEILARVPLPGSEGIAASHDGRVVAVAAPYGDLGKAPTAPQGVRLIDTASHEVTRTLGTDNIVFPVCTTARGQVLAGEAVVTRRGGASALAEHAPGRLSVWDIASGELRGAAMVGRCPLTIIASPDGSRAYVAAVVESTVSVVDLDTFEVLDTIQIARAGEPGAHGMAYLPAAAFA